MPRGDGTGPLGLGPRTGRAAGFCAGYAMPGYMNPIPGRRFSRGFGIGWGRGRGLGKGFWGSWRGFFPTALEFPPAYHPKPSPDEEKNYLENVIKSLEAELEEIRTRIKELEREK